MASISARVTLMLVSRVMISQPWAATLGIHSGPWPPPTRWRRATLTPVEGAARSAWIGAPRISVGPVRARRQRDRKSQPDRAEKLMHQNDAGSEYTSLRCTMHRAPRYGKYRPLRSTPSATGMTTWRWWNGRREFRVSRWRGLRRYGQRLDDVAEVALGAVAQSDKLDNNAPRQILRY